MNPLTVTSGRLQKMNFTQPFFITNLGIAVKSEKDGMFLRFVMRILSTPLFLGLAALMVVILVFGFLTWLFERRASDVEFSNNAKGLWDAFWWSAVTMTAVGYGDKAPKTIGGRVVAICWMLTSVVIISSYTAIIATSLTVNELELSIDNTKELRSAKIGTVALSTAESYLTDSKYDYEPFSSIQAALHGIAKGEIDAVVYDEPILNYEIQNLHLKNEIIIAPNSLSIEYYSFAIPFQRDITKEINLSLIKQIKSNDWKGELRKYSLK